MSRHQPFKLKTDRIKWRDDASDLKAWQTGMTGYPIVDAGMRQLNQTGWMHNRLRMVTAMFLTKNLLIDWRLGEKFCPELADVPASKLHDVNKFAAAARGTDYPDYIVEYKEGRERALEAFKGI